MSIITKLLTAVGILKPAPAAAPAPAIESGYNWIEVCREGTGPNKKAGRISYRGKVNGVHNYSVCDFQTSQIPELIKQLGSTFRTNDFRLWRGVQECHDTLTLHVFSYHDPVCVARVTLLRSASTVMGGSANYQRRAKRIESAVLKFLAD